MVCGGPFYCANYEHVPPSHDLFPFKVSPWLFSSVWDTPPSLPKVTPNIYRPCAHRWGLMALQKSLHWAELELVRLYNQRGSNTIQAIHHPAISIRPQTDLEWTAQWVRMITRTHTFTVCASAGYNVWGTIFVECVLWWLCFMWHTCTRSYVREISS